MELIAAGALMFVLGFAAILGHLAVQADNKQLHPVLRALCAVVLVTFTLGCPLAVFGWFFYALLFR